MRSIRSALRRTGVALPVTALLLTLAACGGAAEGEDDAAAGGITVEHAQGSTDLAGTPEKVFVYDFAALSVLDELGVAVDGIPKEGAPAQFSDYVEDEDVADIGTLFEPDYELVAEEQPDLVIIGGRSAATYPELSTIAPTVDLSNDWAENVASSEENALKLGEIFGKQAEAQAMVDELETSIQETKQIAAGAGNGLIVLTTGGEVTAYGAGGRFGFLHDALGLAPAAEITEEEQHGQAVSFEFVLETNPDWLFVIDRDSAIGEGTQAAEQVFDNAIIAKTKAAQNDQIVYVDPTSWYILGGGVPALQAVADEVRTALEGASGA